MPTAILDDRALVSVSGADAEHFLQNILTVDLDALREDEAKPGALLTPQGKILFDFLVSRHVDGGFLLECRANIAGDFVRRLNLYKLRAKVVIVERAQSAVAVSWQADSTGADMEPASGRLRDTRFLAGLRVLRNYGGFETGSAAGDTAAWHALRILSGIAESGLDYALGDVFPHDVLLDQTGGIGFRKGCYVGQEVVSRMQHRGTARRRFLIATAAGPLPAPGADILADGRVIGTLGSVSGKNGLALVRIDKVKSALDENLPITTGGVGIELAIPAWATFTFPQAEPAVGDA